jgi:hypothetical protein
MSNQSSNSTPNRATGPDRQLTLPEKSHQDYLDAVGAHDALRVEYLNGDIVMTPARSPHHQFAAAHGPFCDAKWAGVGAASAA